MDVYTFAYGSNMNPAQMRVRCPSAKRVGPLVLPGGRLVFRSCADVTIDSDAAIAGGIWRITAQDDADLDRYEGVRIRWYLKRWIKLRINGESHDVSYYTMRIKIGVMPPARAYFETIRKGYEFFGHDEGPLIEALHDAYDNKKVTQTLRDRHFRKGLPLLQRRIMSLDTGPHVSPVLTENQSSNPPAKGTKNVGPTDNGRRGRSDRPKRRRR